MMWQCYKSYPLWWRNCDQDRVIVSFIICLVRIFALNIFQSSNHFPFRNDIIRCESRSVKSDESIIAVATDWFVDLYHIHFYDLKQFQYSTIMWFSVPEHEMISQTISHEHTKDSLDPKFKSEFCAGQQVEDTHLVQAFWSWYVFTRKHKFLLLPIPKKSDNFEDFLRLAGCAMTLKTL